MHNFALVSKSSWLTETVKQKFFEKQTKCLICCKGSLYSNVSFNPLNPILLKEEARCSDCNALRWTEKHILQ